MKTVYLVRHAKGEIQQGQTTDFRRSITAGGRQDALKVGESLKATGEKLAVIISSPAFRARQTASVLAGKLGYRTKAIRTRKSLYDQDQANILKLLQEMDPAYDSVMLVGHNPSLSDLARKLCEDFKADLPTSGAVAIEFETDRWAEVGAVKGLQKLYEIPGRADKRVGSDKKAGKKKNLGKKLLAQISSILEEQDSGSAQSGPVKKAARKLVRLFVEQISRGSGKSKKK